MFISLDQILLFFRFPKKMWTRKRQGIYCIQMADENLNKNWHVMCKYIQNPKKTIPKEEYNAQ